LRLRVDDAVRATRVALREGILAGGGTALLRASRAIDVSALAPDEAAGAGALRLALCEPARRIAENAGIDGSVAVERTLALGDCDGLDVTTGQYGDLIEAGVVDPAIVARASLEAAASVAKVVLTTEAAV